MTELSFNVSGSSRLIAWVEKIRESYDSDGANRIFSAAMSIGMMAMKYANINGDDSLISSAVAETVSSALGDVRNDVATMVSELKKIGFGNEGSSKKGKSNELLILKKLQSSISDWEFSRISSEAMSCDLVAVSGTGSRVMIELKDYTAPVPSKEIKKFIRDVEAGSPDAGLFLSTGSVTGQIEDYIIDVRLINGKKTPLLFVANCSPTSWSLAFLLLEKIMKNSDGITNLAIGNLLINNLAISFTDTIERMRSIDDALSRMRAEYNDTRKKINDLLDGTYQGIMSLEVSLKAEIKTIIATLSETQLIAEPDHCDYTILSNDTFAKFLSSANKKPAYSALYTNASSIKGIAIGYCKKTKGLLILNKKTNMSLAYTNEKPASLQLVYTHPLPDAAQISLNYEVYNQAGQVYFNLSKIKDAIGEQLLANRIRDLRSLTLGRGQAPCTPDV